MTRPDLPYELWCRILSLLRSPVPEARSNAPRSSMSQPDLASAIRTCKLFQSISEPLLYTTIVTDRLDLLFPTTAPELALKRRLFANTKSLFLEYAEKSPEPPYSHLFEEGGFHMLASPLGATNLMRTILCAEETHAMIASLLPLLGGATRKLFPKLRTVAIASIYGGDDEMWRYYNAYVEVTKTPRISKRQAKRGATAPAATENPTRDAKSCAELFHQIIHSSDVSDLCVRGQEGPLHAVTSPSAAFEHPLYGKKTLIALSSHIPFDSHQYSIPFGSKARYVSDCPSDTDRDIIYKRMEQLVVNIAKLRTKNPGALLSAEPFSTDVVDIEMHFSVKHPGIETETQNTGQPEPPLPIHDARERRRLKQMGDNIQAQFRKSSGVEDRFRWFPSIDAGVCPVAACYRRHDGDVSSIWQEGEV